MLFEISLVYLLFFLVIFFLFLVNIKMSDRFLYVLIIYIVGNKLLLLEEEIILVFAVLQILDAAGGIVKEVIWDLLEVKSILVENKLVEYLKTKDILILLVKNVYFVKRVLQLQVLFLYEGFFSFILNVAFYNYLLDTELFGVYSGASALSDEIIEETKEEGVISMRYLVYCIEYLLLNDDSVVQEVIKIFEEEEENVE
jgi:hypothetical protein